MFLWVPIAVNTRAITGTYWKTVTYRCSLQPSLWAFTHFQRPILLLRLKGHIAQWQHASQDCLHVHLFLKHTQGVTENLLVCGIQKCEDPRRRKGEGKAWAACGKKLYIKHNKFKWFGSEMENSVINKAIPELTCSWKPTMSRALHTSWYFCFQRWATSSVPNHLLMYLRKRIPHTKSSHNQCNRSVLLQMNKADQQQLRCEREKSLSWGNATQKRSRSTSFHEDL